MGRQTVKGLITPCRHGARVNYDSILYAPTKLVGVPQKDWGRIITEDWALEGLRTQLCLRPDWNKNPLSYFLVPERMIAFVRPGDEIEGSAHTSDRNNPEKNCLGTLDQLGSVNGERPIQNRQRKNWVTQTDDQRCVIGSPPFAGNLATLLTMVHACPGRGDRTVVVGSDKSGKTCFLQELAEETIEGVEVVFILGERPEEVIDTRRLLPKDRGIKLFVALEDEDELFRIATTELGCQYAMRRAEIGHEVVVFIDSLTKTISDPINGLEVPSGLGIVPGAINPLMKVIVTKILSIGGRYAEGSITVIATVLNEADIASQELMAKCRRSATGVITFNQNIAQQRVYPALDTSVIEAQGKGGKVFWQLTDARRSADWMNPSLEVATRKLQEMVGPEACLKEIMRKDARDRIELLRANALTLATERLAQLKQLVEQGADDKTIWFHFKIAPPGGPSIKELLTPKSATPEPPVATRVTTTSVVPTNGNGKTAKAETPAGQPTPTPSVEAVKNFFQTRGPDDP